MLDAGAQPNLIKVQFLLPETEINYNFKPKLKGIGNSSPEVIGMTKLKIDNLGVSTNFIVVPDSFPIKTGALLGSEFCDKTHSIIDFKRELFTFDNRSHEFEKEEVCECEALETKWVFAKTRECLAKGYIPKIEIAPGVTIGGIEVENCPCGRVKVPIRNSARSDVIVRIRIVPYIESKNNTNELPQFNIFFDPCKTNFEENQITPNISNENNIKENQITSDNFEENLTTFNNSNKNNTVENQVTSDIFYENNLEENRINPNKFHENSINLSRNSNETKQSINNEETDPELDDYLNSFTQTICEKQSEIGTVEDEAGKFDFEISYRIENTNYDIEQTIFFINEDLNFDRETIYTYEENDSSPISNVQGNIDKVDIIKELINLDTYNGEIRLRTSKICEKYSDIFQLPDEKLTQTNMTSHAIELNDQIPVHVKQYRYLHMLKGEIETQINKMLKDGIIEKSNSPYNSPLWIVPKKPDSQGNKKWRLVIDFRELNKKTISDAYPIPNMDEIIDQLSGSKYFSVLDLASGFHQIPMRESDKCKTAFSTPFGHYHFTRMPFGLKNSPATFQRQMDILFQGLQNKKIFVYIDDCIIHGKTLEEHHTKLQEVVERLRMANMKLQPEKCKFYQSKVIYLGHEISSDGFRPEKGKINSILNFPRPKNQKNIKQLLGLAGYYRKFIPNFAKKAKPLTILLKKNVPFRWTET